jgi:transcriptional regulator with XRE-family HTH domain
MPKAKTREKMDFGARLAELRKERGFTQLELAEQAGLSRRMLAYYEGQSEHPPTTHLPSIARALGVTTDELLGLVAVKATARPKDSRLQRRMQEIEKLDAPDRRQVLQLLDAFIEKGQLKKKVQRVAQR